VIPNVFPEWERVPLEDVIKHSYEESVSMIGYLNEAGNL